MVVIFGAGTGNPFFTTGTAAAFRSAEIIVSNLNKPGNISKAIKGETVAQLANDSFLCFSYTILQLRMPKIGAHTLQLKVFRYFDSAGLSHKYVNIVWHILSYYFSLKRFSIKISDLL